MSSTLPSPGVNNMWVIDSIWPNALGTITVYNVAVTSNVGTTQARIGGQVGGATNGTLSPQSIAGPIVCTKGDQTIVVITATGASVVSLTINAHLEPC